MIDLVAICREGNIAPRVVWEVGANHPNQVHVADLIPAAVRVELFEPHPYFFGELREFFAGQDKVLLHNVALAGAGGYADLRNDGCSSYLDGTRSPSAGAGGPEKDVVRVLARTVGAYDRGDIDVLAIDTEGSEWEVISRLVSRPGLICVEMAWPAGGYVNPHGGEIHAWLAAEGYGLVESDGQDEVYVR
jgi:FkbM family methyltransferase